MKLLIINMLTLVMVFSAACKKSEEKSGVVRSQGKYIGSDCSRAQVIQVIEPVDKRFKNSYFYKWNGPAPEDRVNYQYAVYLADSLPEAYKDGAPFCFTITDVQAPVHHMACAFPVYVVTLKDISR